MAESRKELNAKLSGVKESLEIIVDELKEPIQTLNFYLKNTYYPFFRYRQELYFPMAFLSTDPETKYQFLCTLKDLSEQAIKEIKKVLSNLEIIAFDKISNVLENTRSQIGAMLVPYYKHIKIYELQNLVKPYLNYEVARAKRYDSVNIQISTILTLLSLSQKPAPPSLGKP